LSESERFIDPEAFTATFNGVVEYIFKSSKLLNSMKDSISDIIINFKDTAVLHKIAESFEKKKDTLQAEKIYTRIMEIDSTDEKAVRKRTYFQALRDPMSINDDDLPPIDLINDMETMRSIEINYLQYKGKNTTKKPNSGPVSEVSRKIKKRRRKKVRWPKNFDPTNPKHTAKRPDPERWLPKMERVKYRGLAKKKGYMKKTQGSTHVDQTTNRGNFKSGPSTATKGVVKSKKRGKGRRR